MNPANELCTPKLFPTCSQSYGKWRMYTDDDIIISACLDFVLAEICRRLGVKNFIASEVEYDTKKLKRFCYKENKVKMFRERYPDGEIDNLYTDSYNDKPLMEISKNVFFVKGSKITQIKKDGVEVQ